MNRGSTGSCSEWPYPTKINQHKHTGEAGVVERLKRGKCVCPPVCRWLCTVEMQESGDLSRKSFDVWSQFTIILPSLSEQLFPLTQVQQSGLVDSSQWKNWSTNQTNIHKHKVSRCSFQWLKGAIALVNLPLSHPNLIEDCRQQGDLVLEASGTYSTARNLSARVPHPLGHWVGHTLLLSGMLALPPQLAKLSSAAPPVPKVYFHIFFFYLFTFAAVGPSNWVSMPVSPPTPPPFPGACKTWVEVCVGYLLLEKQCPCCFTSPNSPDRLLIRLMSPDSHQAFKWRHKTDGSLLCCFPKPRTDRPPYRTGLANQ